MKWRLTGAEKDSLVADVGARLGKKEVTAKRHRAESLRCAARRKPS